MVMEAGETYTTISSAFRALALERVCLAGPGQQIVNLPPLGQLFPIRDDEGGVVREL